jgi:hypothetical protein
MSDTSQLQDLLRGALLSYSSDMPVSAESLSATVIESLDPHEAAPALVRWGCVLELRQLARPLLRREFEVEKSDAHQDMFEGLQDRYPGTGDHKGLYMPRQMMTEADYLANIARLENEAQAKQQHADALRAEYMEKLSMGILRSAA